MYERSAAMHVGRAAANGGSAAIHGCIPARYVGDRPSAVAIPQLSTNVSVAQYKWYRSPVQMVPKPSTKMPQRDAAAQYTLCAVGQYCTAHSSIQ
eukprot:3147158-Rhodomonas_salina.2